MTLPSDPFAIDHSQTQWLANPLRLTLVEVGSVFERWSIESVALWAGVDVSACRRYHTSLMKRGAVVIDWGQGGAPTRKHGWRDCQDVTARCGEKWAEWVAEEPDSRIGGNSRAWRARSHVTDVLYDLDRIDWADRKDRYEAYRARQIWWLRKVGPFAPGGHNLLADMIDERRQYLTRSEMERFIRHARHDVLDSPPVIGT